jgi:SAM-dependent methyltransferase
MPISPEDSRPRRRHLHLPPARGRLSAGQRAYRGALGVVGAPIYALMGHASGVPGLAVRLRAAAIGARLTARMHRAVRSTAIYHLFCFPIDSTRHFEIDFMWRMLADAPIQAYLDVSSPRLLPIMLLDAHPHATATLLNPDARDLQETRSLVDALGFGQRCTLENLPIEEAVLPQGHFDIITSLSVVEHIRDDRAAVATIWRALKRGGRLLLSVPCAATAEEQFLDVVTYDFSPVEADGSTFHQYLYDERLLEERVFTVTGRPVRAEVYGERIPGIHRRLYERKWIDARYPFWKEPWLMSRYFQRYDAIDRLPGEGVVSLEFVK